MNAGSQPHLEMPMGLPYGPRWNDTAVPSRRLNPSPAPIYLGGRLGHPAARTKSGDMS
jgi:hypothetical protein